MKILVVCLGNICRSPLAQGILERAIVDKGLDWTVDSAGTSAWHSGEKPDARSISTALSHGIDIRNQRARQFTRQDFADFDIILAMDKDNLQQIKSLATSNEDAAKVRLFLDFHRGSQREEVPDPYYDGGFEAVFEMLEQASTSLINNYLKAPEH